MGVTTIVFLPVIILLGLVTSYEDISFGKIKNKYIVFALSYAILARLILNLEVVVPFLTGLLFCFLTWKIGFWTAGDAKLFLAFSLLLPFDNLVRLFVSVFSVSTLIMLLANIQKFKVNLVDYKLADLLYTGLILLVIPYILTLFNVNNIIISYFASFVFLILFETLEGYSILILLPVLVFRLIFDGNIYTMSFIVNFFVMFLFLVILKNIFLNTTYSIFTKSVETKILKPGQVPAEDFLFEKNKVSKEKSISAFSRLFKKHYIRPCSEGLTNEDISKIRRHFNSILVHEVVPFAPFIFLGALVTLLFLS